jgi:DNA replication protein DnaC
MTTNDPPDRGVALATETRICKVCERAFDAYVDVPSQRTCPACIDAQYEDDLVRGLDAWRAESERKLDEIVLGVARAAGLREHELLAASDRVPVELKRLLPKDGVRMLLDDAPRDASALVGHTFGLIGGQGVGKTMCLAALLRRRVELILRYEIAHRDAAPREDENLSWKYRASFVWINWPETAALVKATVMNMGGAHAVDRLTLRAMHAPILVLDDLGRERLARNYDEDFAFGVLDRIVDGRARDRRPTYWTSNLERVALATRYGAAMTSRLLGAAPAIEVPELRDLRLVR